MNKNLINIKTIGIPVAILLIVILGVIYLLTQKGNSNNLNFDTNTASYPESSEAAGITVFPVENLKEVKLSDSVLTFNDSYIVNTIMQTKSVSGIKCGDVNSSTSACIINAITDGQDTYYLSTPFEPVADVGITTSNTEIKQLDGASGTVSLKYSYLNVVNENGDILADQALVTQVYGCIKSGVCVGSGTFPIAEKQSNMAAVTKFEDFVKSINFK